MSNADKVAFRKPETEALARELLGGKTPTPARVRDLLRELDTRRKEPVIVDTAEPTDIAPPRRPDPELGPAPLPPTDVSSAEEILSNAPDEVQRDAVKEYLGQYNAFDEQRRNEILKRPLSQLRKSSRIETLSAAAAILIGELDDQQRDRVIEIAMENGWPPWVIVLGAVARSADLQELNAGEFSDKWLNRPEEVEKTAGVVAKCQMCGGVIPGARRNQQFCCTKHGCEQHEHSDGCALAHIRYFNDAWVDTRR